LAEPLLAEATIAGAEGTARGMTESDGTEGAEDPKALFAITVALYVPPLVKLLIVHDVAGASA